MAKRCCLSVSAMYDFLTPVDFSGLGPTSKRQTKEPAMRFIIASALITMAPLSAFAAPPEGAKLSEILAKVEQTPDLEYIDEVDWNDRGYYEIEYFMKNGAKAEIKIDPKTGEPVR